MQRQSLLCRAIVQLSSPRQFRSPFLRSRDLLARRSSTMAHTPQYQWIDGAENLEMYTKGGYHPVEIGHILHDRYEIVEKLGYGGWSTVWLARDSRQKELVALKVGIADSLPHEIKALRALQPASPSANGCHAIPRIFDEFRVQGPNGSHPCYTTEPALCSLRECSFSRLFPLDVSRALAYELALAVAYIHSRGYAHGGRLQLYYLRLLINTLTVTADIHLRNVLVKAPSAVCQLSIDQFRVDYGKPDTYPIEREDGGALPPNVPKTATVPLSMGKRANKFTLSDARILLSDFGEAFKPAAESRLGKDCHTPVDFRPPDARFQPDIPLSFSTDIWSLATAIWDIVGMQSLFSSAFASENEVVCQIADTLGPLPNEWSGKWEAETDFFDNNGNPRSGRYIWPKIGEAFEGRVQHFRREDNMGEFGQEETAAILDMLSQMLKLRPQERINIEDVLGCEWMSKWARLDYERAQAMR